MSPDHATPGNGLLLFFRLEFSLRDPDGYHVTISAENDGGVY